MNYEPLFVTISFGTPKWADVVLLYEVLDFVVADLVEGLSLDPLGEVVSDC